MVDTGFSTERALRVGLGVLAAGAAVALLYYGRVFFITLIVASMIAFLLEPAVRFFMKLRMPRGLASFVVCSITLVLLYLTGLGIYLQAQSLSADMPAYGERLNEVVASVAGRMQRLEDGLYKALMPHALQPAPTISAAPDALRGKRKKAEPPPPPADPQVQQVHVQQDPVPVFTYVYGYLHDFYDVLLMASFVPFLVFFLLSWRDHFRARWLYLFPAENRTVAVEAWAGIGDMVRAYVIGNFLLGLLLSVASALLFASVKLPYWLVVAPISGFVSLVPYIGLPLAMMPPLIAALPVSREPALYLFITISVAVLHLLALNLLYPRFVAARVHLNPLVATVALMFWGMMWGAPGLLLAIPLTAGLKALLDNVNGLKAYGRLLGD